jgi:beta-N-acetylhexosaminidase
MMRLSALSLLTLLLLAACAGIEPAPPEKGAAALITPETKRPEPPKEAADTPQSLPSPEEKPQAKPEPETATGQTPEEQRPPAPDPLSLSFSSLDLPGKIGQLLMVEVRNPSNGRFLTRLTEEYRTWAAGIQPGGFILFADNLVNPEQTRKLIEELKGTVRIPPFIALDEEGGSVSRLNAVPGMGTTPLPTNSSIGASGLPENAARAAASIAGELSALGFSVNFAPVADVHIPGSGSIIGDRSYGSSPELVARMAAAFSRSLEEGGVMSVAKHFPGHGAASGDSHDGRTLLTAAPELIARRELRPFKEAVKINIGGIMLGHITVPSLDAEETPATLSKAVATDLLRGELGYKGLVFTDSLRMRAVTAYYRPDTLPLLAFEAGADILLMPVSPVRSRDLLIEAYLSGRIQDARLASSLKRIEEAKRRYAVSGVPRIADLP